MAISDSFNVNNALNSQSYAYKCWYNYNYESNTMGISTADMGKITQEWKGEVSNWEKHATNDENAYEIEDDDYSAAKKNGAETAKESTEFDGKADNNTVNNVVSWAGGITGGIMGVVAGITALSKSRVSNPFTSAIIGTVLLANAVYLKVADPNKDATDACQIMTEQELPKAQASLNEAQGVMENAEEETRALSDEAQTQNEDANEDIEEEKTKKDMYEASCMALQTKAASGKKLSKDEISLMETLQTNINNSNTNINDTFSEANENVGEIYDEMDSYQSEYDYSAETVAEVQGATDYAAGFDEATKDNASAVKNGATAAIVGSAGVVVSGIQGIATAGLNIPQHIAGGVAVATGGAAGILYKNINSRQAEYQAIAEEEIAVREETQDLNTTTDEIYNERISDYEGNMEMVADYEIEMPEENVNTTVSGNTTGETVQLASTGVELTTESEDDKSGDKKDKEEKV